MKPKKTKSRACGTAPKKSAREKTMERLFLHLAQSAPSQGKTKKRPRSWPR